MGKPRDNVRYLDLKTNTEDKRKKFPLLIIVAMIITAIIISLLLYGTVFAQSRERQSPSLGVLRGQQIEEGLNRAYEESLQRERQIQQGYFSSSPAPHVYQHPYSKPYLNPFSDYYGLPQGEVDRIIQEQLREGGGHE